MQIIGFSLHINLTNNVISVNMQKSRRYHCCSQFLFFTILISIALFWIFGVFRVLYKLCPPYVRHTHNIGILGFVGVYRTKADHLLRSYRSAQDPPWYLDIDIPPFSLDFQVRCDTSSGCRIDRVRVVASEILVFRRVQ